MDEASSSINSSGASSQEADTTSGMNGLVAPTGPVLPPLIQIADNVPLSQTKENHAPQYRNLLLALLPLAGVFVFFLIKLYRQRDISEGMVAKQKSQVAYKNFQQAVKKLDQSGSDLPDFCRSLGRCVHQYLQERFICSMPYIDEQSLQPLIDQDKLNKDAARELLSIVDEIDLHRYAADVSEPTRASKLLKDTVEAVKKCDL